MDKDIVINVKNVTKTYQLYNSHADRVKEAFHPLRKKYNRPFNALNDVSFQVEKGEFIGIIGRNGSGKSTLLQVICGILLPTLGSVEANGRIAALLELGAGFNPEFTGRENVYLNASILGFGKEEIDQEFDKIAAFADIGQFMEQPVKSYSSGMYVRLAFAVQVCMEPEVLIVDEALSVGDFFFQQKCLRRIRELRERHVTLVFVSHDMATVRDLCETCIYLKEGKLVFFGESQKAIQLYFQECAEKPDSNEYQDSSEIVSEYENSDPSNNIPPDTIKEFKQNAIWVSDNNDGTKDLKAKILAVSVFNKQNEVTMKARIGDEIRFRVLYETYTKEPVHLSITFKNRYDQVINCTGSYTCGIEPLNLDVGSIAMFEFRMKLMIEAGLYTFIFDLSHSSNLPNRGISLDKTPWLGPLTVEWNYENEKAPFLGMCNIPVEGEFVHIKKRHRDLAFAKNITALPSSNDI